MNEGESTRSGKIARLPAEVRTALNGRIRDGELSPTLLPWLNGQPAVRKILRRDFDDADISPQNLSDWRQGGYRDWLERRQQLEEKRELADYCLELAESGKSLLDGSASIMGGKLMEILEGVDIESQRMLLAEKPDSLVGLIGGLAALQGQANQGHKIKQGDRRLDLEERKFEGRFLKLFEKYYLDQKAREILEGKATREVKMDQLRLHIFGAKPNAVKINHALPAPTKEPV
jgi:hypothetical protein